MRYKGLNERFFSNSRYQQKTSAFCLFSAVIARLVDDGFGEDGGDLVGGEGEAGAYGGEGGGELRVVFAEVLGGDEEVVVAGGVEPVADGGPEAAGHERVDEAQLGESVRRDVLGRPAAWTAEPMRLPP